MKQRNLPFAAAALLALAACQQPANDGNIAIDNGVNAASRRCRRRNAAAERDQRPPIKRQRRPATLNEADDSGSEAPPNAALIPAQYRGRWGMVAADCNLDARRRQGR